MKQTNWMRKLSRLYLKVMKGAVAIAGTILFTHTVIEITVVVKAALETDDVLINQTDYQDGIPNEEQIRYRVLVANFDEWDGKIEFDFVDRMVLVYPDGQVVERPGNVMLRTDAMKLMEATFENTDLTYVDENGNYQIDTSKPLTADAQRILEQTQIYLEVIKNAQFATAN